MLELEYPDQMPMSRSLGRGRWLVCEPWTFTINRVTTTIPAGFVTDLFSVPWPANWFVPRDQRDNRPALIHDWLYATSGLRQTAHDRPAISWSDSNLALEIAADRCGLSWIQRNLIITGLLVGSGMVWRKYDHAGCSIENPCLRELPVTSGSR
jgi:hypothetical protein